MKKLPFISPLAVISSCILVACGGPGGEFAGATIIKGKVIDGYVAGATVCLDVNANSVCDSTEPSATTDSTGAYSFSYAGTTSGLHVIAQIPIGATDSSTGTVTLPYNLSAPADSATTVTPLTTLVSNAMKFNPSFTAAQAESAIIASNNLPASAVLGIDVTTNATLQTVAQVATRVLAQTNATLTADPTFISAANSSGNGSVATQASQQSITLLQTKLLAPMQNYDGSINSAYINGGAVNTTAVSTLVTNAINGDIQNISAAALTGAASPVNMQNEIQSGLVNFNKRSGGYYALAGVPTNATSPFFRYALISMSATGANQGKSRDLISGVWQTELKYYYDLTSAGTWVAEYENGSATSSVLSGGATFSNNCFSSPQTPNGVVISGCASSLDLSGKPLGKYFSCNDLTGAAISGCNTSTTFPAGAKGYNFVVNYNQDQYQLNLPLGATPLATTGSNDVFGFISYLQTPGNYVAHSSNCTIISNVASYNATTKTGTLNWYSNSTNSCTGVNTLLTSGSTSLTLSTDSPTPFKVASVYGQDILEFQPSNLRIANNSANQGVGIVVYVNNVNGLTGVYQGNLYPASFTTYLPFGMGVNFMNPTAWNFVAGQYGLPAVP